MDETLAANLGEHVPQMYRVALRILGDDDKAQDVVQDACVKALRAAGGFNGRSALTTWLHRITVNCALDHLDSRMRTERQHVDLDSVVAGLPERLAAGPADAAERRELCSVARQFLEALPEDCRRAFILTQLDGYSYDDAAAIEDQPRGTMASRVFRAKRLLLERIAEQTDRRTTQ
ncbi:MAG TPA: RNA polymerase sigma factor [Phycisphaerae bacterium]|nr:RNA polymerase sigma factor [Phycisphaerae bacterium]